MVEVMTDLWALLCGHDGDAMRRYNILTGWKHIARMIDGISCK
jgi:hypothetical protein